MLKLEAVESFYGASQVLFGVDLEIGAGEVVSLIGRNGMGKTTTVRTILGLNRVAAGSIRLDGAELAGQPSHKIARAGIGLVPEGRLVFGNLTVAENLAATARARYSELTAKSEDWNTERVYAMLPGLAERADHYGRTLSGGEQQMLAIGRALMTNPRVLILDEATEGLAPLVREDIWRLIGTLKAAGQAILVIDKDRHALARVADRHAVLAKGRVVWRGDGTALLADTTMHERFLGLGAADD